MNITIRNAGKCFVATLLVLLVSCTQLPTEKKEVPDTRPSITFSAPPDMDAAKYSVFVDNLDMGLLSNFLTKPSALKVLPGSHLLRIENSGKTVLEESVYLGEGAVRSIQVHP